VTVQLELPLAAARRPRRTRLPSGRRPGALERLALALARRVGAAGRLRGLRVLFNGRLRTSAGRADFAGRAIELNPRLLDRHPAELVPTLAHELAHLIAGPRARHGPRWRAVIEALGFRAEACHRLDVDGLGVARRAWIWRCGGCGESYRRRHRGARRFACGRCGRRLRLEGPAAAAAGGDPEA
jgi:predicted SprT family Zn-dependent metalloprotease